ncbi:universal stress protein [Nocardiopsis sp. LOL_012]|uniref:universal stress protein n=1 Tax=Nocardiopsis sp. LOL_012 TaxID=3345409 RepID=UPI003A85503E
MGVDGSEIGLRAAEHAAEEALRGGADLTLMAVHEERLDDSVSRWPSDLDEKDALAAVEEARERVRSVAPGLDPRVRVVAGSPAEELLRHARDFGLVIVGHRGRGGFLGMRIGSVAYQVAAHAPGDVLVTSGEAADPGASGAVVGVDGSTNADDAVLAALETASRHGDRVRAVWAWHPVASRGRRAEEAEEEQYGRLAEALARHTSDFPGVEVVREVVRSQPAAALLEAASGARLVVVGARGARGFARLSLGGVAHAVLHHAPCPVLVVRRR